LLVPAVGALLTNERNAGLGFAPFRFGFFTIVAGAIESVLRDQPRGPQLLRPLEVLNRGLLLGARGLERSFLNSNLFTEDGVLLAEQPQLFFGLGKLGLLGAPLEQQFVRVVLDEQDDLGLEASVALFYIGRFLERIADHGVNIAQNITFAVAGNFPEDY